MYLCRAALQRFCPLIRSSITHRAILRRDVVPQRFMSSVPGGTGENLVYLVVCGGAFAGALTYAYRTVTSDSARFTDRITEIEARPKNEWPPKNAEEAEEAIASTTEPPAVAAAEPPAVAAAEPPAEAAAEPPPEAAAEPPAEAAAEPPAEAATEEAAPAPVELVVEVLAEKSDSVVETAAEAVAEATEWIVEVDGVVEETAEEVSAVVNEVEKIVEEVEAADKKLEGHALPVVKEATAESTESHGTEAASQEEEVTESANTEA